MTEKTWEHSRDAEIDMHIAGRAEDNDLCLTLNPSDWTAHALTVNLDATTARQLAIELFTRSGFEGRLIECLSTEAVRLLKKHDKKEKKEEVKSRADREKEAIDKENNENFTQVVALAPSISGLKTDYEGVVEGILIRTWDGKKWELLVKSEGRWGIPIPVDGVMNHG